jgi:hypothetical protein
VWYLICVVPTSAPHVSSRVERFRQFGTNQFRLDHIVGHDMRLEVDVGTLPHNVCLSCLSDSHSLL